MRPQTMITLARDAKNAVQLALCCWLAAWLCSCSNTYHALQFLGWRPNIRYSPEEYYKAKVIGSGTKARTVERVEFVLANKPPNPTKANIAAAIEWLDLETAGKLP